MEKRGRQLERNNPSIRRINQSRPASLNLRPGSQRDSGNTDLSTKPASKEIERKKKKKRVGFFSRVARAFSCGICSSKPRLSSKNGIVSSIKSSKKPKIKNENDAKKKLLVLDLDGTLVKVSMVLYTPENKALVGTRYDFAIGVSIPP